MAFFKDKIMKLVVAAVCVSIMPQLFFKNGFLLSYFLQIGLESSDVLILLSLPSLIMLVFSVPFAFYADRYGKKKIGLAGICLTFIGYILITLAGSFDIQAAARTIVVGIVLFSIGLTALMSGWFALLSPLIPKAVRGSFFGNLRVSWQIYAIACSFVLTAILEKSTTLGTYQLILIFFTGLLILHIFLYLRIPEKNTNTSDGSRFFGIIAGIPRIQGYMPFCAYCFLLMLATGTWPATLGLLEKNILHFSDDTIVHMGTMLFMGAMTGFYTGGKLVDRFGTKIVFLVVHFSYFLLLSMVVVREMAPVPITVYFGGLTFGLGLIQAASSIALTSEMIALAPQKNTSVITSICNSLQWGGAAISGIVSGKIIELGILAETWSFMGLTLSRYDSLILFNALMVFVFIVTLGLIPSVVNTQNAQWIPNSPKTL